MGMEIVLPPPFVARLFTQRGIFVRLPSRRSTRRLRVECSALRFPVEPEFAIHRSGADLSSDQLLPSDDWFNVASEWAVEMSRTKSQARASSYKRSEFCEQLRCDEYWVGAFDKDGVQEWLDFVSEMLDWLVVRMSPHEVGFAVSPQLLQSIARKNRCAFEGLIDRHDRWAEDWASEGNTENAVSSQAWSALLRTAVG